MVFPVVFDDWNTVGGLLFEPYEAGNIKNANLICTKNRKFNSDIIRYNVKI